MLPTLAGDEGRQPADDACREPSLMPAKTIDLNSKPILHGSPTVRVYTKSSWASAWTLNERLMVQEAVWATAPNVSTATLQHRFGRILVPGKQTVETVTPITIQGHWVMILYTTEDAKPAVWLGYAEQPVTTVRHPRSSSDPQSGVHDIPCYGMDRAIAPAGIIVLPTRGVSRRSNPFAASFKIGKSSFPHLKICPMALPW